MSVQQMDGRFTASGIHPQAMAQAAIRCEDPDVPLPQGGEPLSQGR